MRTATPLSRCCTMRRCTNSIEPTSSPRVGWLATSTLCWRPSSRARVTFCWFPPAPRRARRAGPDVELPDQLGRSAGDRAAVQADAGRIRRLVVLVEHHVVGHGEVADQPVLLPVLRDLGQPGA